MMTLVSEKTNTAMARIVGSLETQPTQLDAGPEQFAANGVLVEDNGAVLAFQAKDGAHASSSDFSDIVSYECFVNKIHVRDIVSEDLAEADLATLTRQAIQLAHAIAKKAAEKDKGVVAIVSADPEFQAVVFRFHGLRENEDPWVSDPNGLEEAVWVGTFKP